MRSVIFRAIVILGVGAVACSSGKTEAPMKVDGWKVVREGLAAPKNCFASRAEYCVKDPAFVDPLIQKALDNRFHGTMPDTDVGAADVLSSAEVLYGKALLEPEGRKKIEALLAARYAQPVITESGGNVTADLGILPGDLTVYKTSTLVVSRSSPLFDSFEWRSTEIGSTLKALANSYPKAATITLKIDLMNQSLMEHWVYVWTRATGRLAVKAPNDEYVSDPIDLDAVIRGEASLNTSKMKRGR